MFLLYCPECGEVMPIQPKQSVGCWCEPANRAFWHKDGHLSLRGDAAVIIMLWPGRLAQAIKELETGPSAGISGMVFKEGNGITEIERKT